MWRQPDATEASVQELNRQMRQALRERGPEDGAVSGPLSVAAQFVAPQLAAANGLQGPEHEAAIVNWLLGQWGDVVRDFDPQAYRAWRGECVERAASQRELSQVRQ